MTQCTFKPVFRPPNSNEIWKYCIRYELYLENCVVQFFWYHSYFIHDFQIFFTDFPSCTGSHKATSIRTQSILILQKLIKMTTNTEFVAPRAESPNRSRLAFFIILNDNKSRLEKTCLHALRACRVHISFILEARQHCI